MFLIPKHGLNFVESVGYSNLAEEQKFSFDFITFFPNVPINETVNYLCEFILENNIDLHIPVDGLRQFLFACRRSVQITRNRKIYRQKDGVTIGSPLESLFAEVLVEKPENVLS